MKTREYAPQPGKVPDRIGKYDIVNVLGRGGMGVVYLARDARLGRNVAIKTLTEGFIGDPDMLKRFLRESNQLGALCHPNIVVVYDTGDHGGTPFIVMEYVEGKPLDSILKDPKPTPMERRLSIVEQVCMALAYAHRAGVIHRDVKPGNVIVQRDGTAKLLDFGIARGEQPRLDYNLTNTGTLIGTPAYMAPERFQGVPIDGRSDIFSAGVLLYQLVANRLPFDAEFPAIMHQILNENPPPLSQVVADSPPELDAIIGLALAKKPAERYSSADDMASDLRAVVEVVKDAHVSELMSNAEKLFSQESYSEAEDALRRLIRLDSKHIEGKRLLSLVGQRLNQQANERKGKELSRLAEQAASARGWDRALQLCEQAQDLTPATTTLLELRGAVLRGRENQQKIARLLAEAAAARNAGDLSAARNHAESAQRIDPNNSEILALCRVLKEAIEDKRRKEELGSVLASAKALFEHQRLEEAAGLLAKAEAISPNDAELIRFRDQLATAQAEEKQRALVNKLEEKAALTTTVDKLRAIAAEVNHALHEFPAEPSLLRLRLQLEPRMRQLEDDALVRQVSHSALELPPEEAIQIVHEALIRVPGHEQLLEVESALSERIARKAKHRRFAELFSKARQAIDDNLYLEAVRILEHCQVEGHSSIEIQNLLELAKSSASQRISQDLIGRTYGKAKQLIDLEDYESAVQLLRSALRQVDEPVLRRQLDEAVQKQTSTHQQANQILERLSALIEAGLAEEASNLLDRQPASVKRLTEIASAARNMNELAEGERKFWNQMGRAYATLATVSGIAEINTALNSDSDGEKVSSRTTAQTLLRHRVEEIAVEEIHSAILQAREAFGREDSLLAEGILNEASTWSVFASLTVQEELRVLLAEITVSKKVLRFRRALRK